MHAIDSRVTVHEYLKIRRRQTNETVEDLETEVIRTSRSHSHKVITNLLRNV